MSPQESTPFASLTDDGSIPVANETQGPAPEGYSSYFIDPSCRLCLSMLPQDEQRYSPSPPTSGHDPVDHSIDTDIIDNRVPQYSAYPSSEEFNTPPQGVQHVEEGGTAEGSGLPAAMGAFGQGAMTIPDSYGVLQPSFPGTGESFNPLHKLQPRRLMVRVPRYCRPFRCLY